MHKIVMAIFCLSLLIPSVGNSARIPFILDTDLASDVDDVGDLVLALYYDHTGVIDLKAVIADSINAYEAPAIKTILNFYGYGSVPIGANQGSTPSNASSYYSPYTQQLTQAFDPNPLDTRANYGTCAAVYRTALASSPDGSVVIVNTGYAKCLNDLLATAGDGVDSRTGPQLVAAKVKELVFVAGLFPTNAPSAPEWNFAMDPANFSYVVSHWPTPVAFAGIELGNNIYTGPASWSDAATNPVQKAFQLWCAGGSCTANKRQAWGQIGVMYGALGLSGNFSYGGSNGTVTINSSTGADSWATTPNGGQAYLVNTASDAAITTEIQAAFSPFYGPYTAVTTAKSTATMRASFR